MELAALENSAQGQRAIIPGRSRAALLIRTANVQVDSAFRRLKPQHDRFRVGRPL